MDSIKQKNTRNYGIDALRCLAMLCIACLHVMNQGGALGTAGGAAASLLQPLRVLCSCGVNLYALISGWVLVNGSFRPARILELWLQVLFWNLVIAGVGTLLRPGIMEGFWLRYCLPVTQKCFWYFSAYVGVWLLTPILNPGIRGLTERQARWMVLALFLAFSLGTALGYAWQGDPWGIGAGYSVLWLLALYLMGACARRGRLGEGLSPWTLLLIAGAAVAVSCTFRGILDNAGELPEFWEKQRSMLLYYNRPALTLCSLALLLLFARLRIPRTLERLIRWLSPLTFGVYIIHVHHVIWVSILGLYQPLGALPALLVVPAVILAGGGLLFACALLDWGRAWVFKRLRIRQRIEDSLTNLTPRRGDH